MKRAAAFCFLLGLGISPLRAEEPSPDAGSFEVEPPLLVQPDGKPVATPEASPKPDLDVAQLEKKLERAQKSAASAERLWKVGVLAKVEAEQRALRVVRLQAELTKAQLAELQKSVGTSDGMVELQQASSGEMKRALNEAAAAAKAAADQLAKAELEAAIVNLHRQQKLLELGSGRKSDVARAEEKLAALKAK
jgi:hypothetical protein